MTGFAALPLEDSEHGAAAVDGEDVHWAGASRILGPKWAQLPALTVGLLGVQVLWSVEMSYASPYLLQLGLTKSLMAIVFVAGPLSGLIVQPLIGVMSDNSKSRFGRRRPYMLIGSVITISAMALLGFTRWFSTIFTTIGTSANDTLTVLLAIWAIYCMDFSINAVQAVDRALLVDTLERSRQEPGNAWAARMLGIGSVFGFFIGNVDLRKAFPMFGKTQLQILSVIASLLLIATHGMTASCVKERVLVSSSRSAKGFRKEVKDIWNNILTLPRVIRQICMIQFFAWIAWFPILFYTTMYVGELHKRNSPEPQDDAAAVALDEEATRLGSRALFYFSLTALAANFIMPLFIAKSSKSSEMIGRRPTRLFSFARLQIHLCELWAFSHLLFAFCMGATLFTSSVTGATALLTLTGFSWAITQWAPFSLLGEEIHSDSPSEVDDAASIRLLDTRTNRRSTEPRLGDMVWVDDDEHSHLVGGDVNEDASDEHIDHKDDESASSRDSSLERLRPSPLMGNMAARQSRLDVPANGNAHFALNGDTADGSAKPGSLEAKAGIILGIHNLFVVIPQFLVTGMSSVIFALLEPDKSVLHGHHPGNTMPGNGTLPIESANDGAALALDQRASEVEAGPNSVAIIFRVGGVMALVASVLAWRLAKELKRR